MLHAAKYPKDSLIRNTNNLVFFIEFWLFREFGIIKPSVVRTNISHIRNAFDPAFKIGKSRLICTCNCLLVRIFQIFEKLGKCAKAKNFYKRIERNRTVFVVFLKIFYKRSTPVAIDFVLSFLQKRMMEKQTMRSFVSLDIQERHK